MRMIGKWFIGVSLLCCIIIAPQLSYAGDAAIKPPDDGREPFGALAFLSWNHPWNNYMYSDRDLERAVKLIKETGITFVRVDFMWADIEPKQGHFEFGRYDRIVDLLTENGIGILGLLCYTVQWAGPVWNGPPDDNKTFVNYASKVIDRYKGKVKYWEVWNEPDDEQYWIPQDRMVRYTSLLKDVYSEAKRVDPSCKILTGGLSKTITVSLRRIYKNGGGQSFDILAIHPYVNPLNEVSVGLVRGIYRGCKTTMKDNGDDKRIWFTEIGCPGVKTQTKANAWWFGTSPTEEEQAVWVKRFYTKILPGLPDCEKAFWAIFRDTKDHFRNGIDYFGLIRWDFSKKPAFTAYKSAADWWSKQAK